MAPKSSRRPFAAHASSERSFASMALGKRPAVRSEFAPAIAAATAAHQVEPFLARRRDRHWVMRKLGRMVLLGVAAQERNRRANCDAGGMPSEI
jgi:hypothetical protein